MKSTTENIFLFLMAVMIAIYLASILVASVVGYNKVIDAESIIAEPTPVLDQLYVSKQSTKMLIDKTSFSVAQLETNHDWVGVNLELTDLVKLLNHRGDIDNEIIAAEKARYERLMEIINEN